MVHFFEFVLKITLILSNISFGCIISIFTNFQRILFSFHHIVLHLMTDRLSLFGLELTVAPVVVGVSQKIFEDLVPCEFIFVII